MNKTASILVVDDDPAIRQLLCQILCTGGYEVWEAATGQQGLQLTREQRPDLVLLDVRLPDLSGMEVCRRIKADGALADVFVVLVSGEATSTAHKVDGLEIGADDYVTKPVELNEFLARIRTILRLRDTTVALRASEQHYRQLVEILPEAVGLIDLEGRFLGINSQTVAMLGYAEAGELLGKSLFELVPPAVQERLRAGLGTVLRTGTVRNLEATGLRKNGTCLPVELSVAVLRGAHGQPLEIVGVARDLTERKRLEHAILEVSEREQRRIGQDIHDGLCQQLFSTAMACNLLRQDLAAQSRSEAAVAAKILTQINDGIAEARSLARGLSLSHVAREGLAAALQDLAHKTSHDFRVSCVAECPDCLSVSDPLVAAHLYRIASEAVHNAVKHARPRQIVISLAVLADTACLCIADDGIGIDVRQAPGAGLGLEMMRHRADMIGGELSIQRGQSGGTKVSCHFPRSLCR